MAVAIRQALPTDCPFQEGTDKHQPGGKKSPRIIRLYPDGLLPSSSCQSLPLPDSIQKHWVPSLWDESRLEKVKHGSGGENRISHTDGIGFDTCISALSLPYYSTRQTDGKKKSQVTRLARAALLRSVPLAPPSISFWAGRRCSPHPSRHTQFPGTLGTETRWAFWQQEPRTRGSMRGPQQWQSWLINSLVPHTSSGLRWSTL